ncbi:MAG: right-handed parallel beta-helix repeat-containing protein [Candidatus Bipolaricaulota bacterium]|nr:right-handed parallel beta-helix repeat-containing protein [Candidatus Bipolaricaulota bacterium]
MGNARYLSVLGVFALLLLAARAIAMQPSCTVTVQPWQPLQTAVESVPAGAVLCLAAGVWTQGISLQDKVLTLWGAGPDQTILMGAAGTLADGISVSGQSLVTVQGLGIYNFRDGIISSGRSRVSIRDAQLFSNARAGVRVVELAEATLEHSLVSHNLDGVVAEDSAQVTIQYSQILSNTRDGVWLDFVSSGWLIGNSIQHNGRYGVHVYSLENLFVCWRNVVRDNRAGNFYPQMVAYKCQ